MGKMEGMRKRFAATFIKLGKKRNYKGYSEETVLLADIIDLESNKRVADHLWFTFNKSFQQLRLTKGICIEFDARVTKYRKGYVNRRYHLDDSTLDYRLSHPTKICLRQG